MPWQSQIWYCFDKGTVNGRAPNVSGVYALKSSDGRWLYVGESASVASSLLRHLAGDNARLIESHPTLFSFEPCHADERIARRDMLIRELLPLCNKRPG